MTAGRLEQLLRFLETADRLKTVYRAAYLSDQSRHESDAEHTWHMMLFAVVMHREAGLDLDLGHALELILIHDLVEIHAGDTFAYDAAARADQRERECAAAERLFALLPEDWAVRLHRWWEEFEAGATAEARFARCLDHLQAMAQNLFARGRAWRERGVTEEMSRDRNAEAIGLSPEISQLFEALYARAAQARFWATHSGPGSEE